MATEIKQTEYIILELCCFFLSLVIIINNLVDFVYVVINVVVAVVLREKG